MYFIPFTTTENCLVKKIQMTITYHARDSTPLDVLRDYEQVPTFQSPAAVNFRPASYGYHGELEEEK